MNRSQHWSSPCMLLALPVELQEIIIQILYDMRKDAPQKFVRGTDILRKDLINKRRQFVHNLGSTCKALAKLIFKEVKFDKFIFPDMIEVAFGSLKNLKQLTRHAKHHTVFCMRVINFNAHHVRNLITYMDKRKHILECVALDLMYDNFEFLDDSSTQLLKEFSKLFQLLESTLISIIFENIPWDTTLVLPRVIDMAVIFDVWDDDAIPTLQPILQECTNQCSRCFPNIRRLCVDNLQLTLNEPQLSAVQVVMWRRTVMTWTEIIAGVNCLKRVAPNCELNVYKSIGHNRHSQNVMKQRMRPHVYSVSQYREYRRQFTVFNHDADNRIDLLVHDTDATINHKYDLLREYGRARVLPPETHAAC